jgi:hypothetical protein
MANPVVHSIIDPSIRSNMVNDDHVYIADNIWKPNLGMNAVMSKPCNRDVLVSNIPCRILERSFAVG